MVQKDWALQKGVTLTFHLVQKIGPVTPHGNILTDSTYDFGGTSPTRTTTYTYGSCTSGCTTTSPTITATALASNHIYNKVGELVVQQGGSKIAQTNITYSATGNITSTQVWNGTSFIGQTTPNSYNTNGTPQTLYDAANNPTSYAYSNTGYTSCGSCTGYPFPTSITKGGLTTKSTWNGVAV